MCKPQGDSALCGFYFPYFIAVRKEGARAERSVEKRKISRKILFFYEKFTFSSLYGLLKNEIYVTIDITDRILASGTSL